MRIRLPLRTVCLILLAILALIPGCHARSSSESSAAPDDDTKDKTPSNSTASMYGIGGVTWGLLANTTVRLANGNDLLNVGNSSFVFSTFVSDGGNYNVTVAAQPPGQICVVTSGAGTVLGATVTDIQVVCSAGAFSVGGTVSGLQAMTAVTLVQNGVVLSIADNGPFTLPTGFASGDAYHVQVWADPANAHCTVTQATGTVANANISDLAVACAAAPRPNYAFSTNQMAAVEVGQPNFGTASTTLLRSAGTFWTTDRFNRYPYKAFAIPGGPLYIPDFWNYRILVYSGMPASNFADADSVLAGDNLTDQGDGSIYPMAITGGPGYLAVSNQQSYTSIFTFTGFPAVDNNTRVTTGKIDYDCTQQGAGGIGYSDVRIFDNKLLAMDRYYNRLLIWDPLPSDPHQRVDPTSVFGQSNFTICDAQTSASGFTNPTGFYADGNHFIVADAGNNRVLIWNQSISALTSGAHANVVLGQNDLTSNTDHGPTLNTFTPNSIDSDGTMLVVTDMVHHRVLVWNTIPTQNNQPADAVLGQPSATGANCNQSAIARTNPQAQTLCLPTGANIAGPFIVVNDTGNLRFSIFRSQ